MDSLDREMINRLRAKARSGEPPSVLLRAIVAHLAPRGADQFLMVRYFAAAFCFKDGQGHPIYGWFPDGSGELNDARIDRIMTKRIEQSRREWENADDAPAA